MAIELIDTVRPKNNQPFPIVLSNDIQGGIHYVEDLGMLDLIPEKRRLSGMLCYVKNDQFYQLEDDLITWTSIGNFKNLSIKVYNNLSDINNIENPKKGQIVFVENDYNNDEYLYFWNGTSWQSFNTTEVAYNYTVGNIETMNNLDTDIDVPIGAFCFVETLGYIYFYTGIEEPLEDGTLSKWKKLNISVDMDLSRYAIKSEVEEGLLGKANVTHTHEYTEILNHPEIPSLEGFATEEFVTNKIAEAHLPDKEIDLSGYATQAQLAEKADIVHIHSYNELTDTPTIPSLDGYATQEYVGDVVDANVIFDNDMNVVTGLGGIKAGDNLNGLTLKDVVNKLLFPYVAPTISASLTYSPTGSLFEYGEVVSIKSINGNVTKKSEAITSIKFLENSTVLYEKTDGIGSSGSYEYTFEPPIQITSNLSDSRFRFSVTDATNKTYTCSTSGFSFCYPFYYGIVDENYSIGNIINSLTKKIETKGTKAYTYTTNNQCMVIAYPKVYGTLTKITDPNNFDVTGTFVVSELIVNCLDNTNQAYYVYINNASTVSNFRLTFTF